LMKMRSASSNNEIDTADGVGKLDDV